jgi:hypothetical protein
MCAMLPFKESVHPSGVKWFIPHALNCLSACNKRVQRQEET